MWRAVLTGALQHPNRVQLESTYFSETTILIHRKLISMAQDDALYNDMLFSIIMAAPTPPHSSEPAPIPDHFALASPKPVANSDHMDTDSNCDISSSEGSTDDDSSDDNDADDDLMIADDPVKGDDPIEGYDLVEDVHDPVPPVIEDEVAPIPGPDHKETQRMIP